MPQRKEVEPLKATCCSFFIVQLATSISFLSTLTTSKGVLRNVVKQVMLRKALSLKKLKQKRQPIFLSPNREVQKIRAYLIGKIPTEAADEVFHQSFLMVAQLLTLQNIDTLYNDSENALENHITRMESAFLFVFELLFDASQKTLNMNSVMHLLLKWITPSRKSSIDKKTLKSLRARLENILLRLVRESTSKIGSLESIIWPHLKSVELLIIVSSYCENLAEVGLACGCSAQLPFEDETNTDEKKKEIKEMVFATSLLSREINGCRRCPNIRLLHLPPVADDEDSAAFVFAEMLCEMENLEVLVGIPLLKCLRIIKEAEDAPSNISLKHFSENDPEDVEILKEKEFLQKLLPSIESIEILASSEHTINLITCFCNAKCLQIELPEFPTIASQFSQLQTLVIGLGSACCWPLLQSLSTYCTKLQSLTVIQTSFRVLYSQEVKELYLPELQEFRLIRVSCIQRKAFELLLAESHLLKSITLEISEESDEFHELEDELVKQIAPCLSNLETFIVEGPPSVCRLTTASTRALIDKCSKLKILGNLKIWNMQFEEVKYLTNFIKHKNWDLEVINE